VEPHEQLSKVETKVTHGINKLTPLIRTFLKLKNLKEYIILQK
jgi:hypothetical protein